MRRYSEAVKADVRRRMSPPHRQRVAQISAELGIHIVTLYNWSKAWRLQGEGPVPEQVERWRQAAQDANEKPVLTLKEQRELEKLRALDQPEIKAL